MNAGLAASGMVRVVMKVIHARCGAFRVLTRAIVGLLTLAVLLAYGAPGGVDPLSPGDFPMHAHQVSTGPHIEGAELADDASRDAACNDCGENGGAGEDGICCTATRCAGMANALPATTMAVIFPEPNATIKPLAMALPDGIHRAPDLRPPL